MGKALLKAMLTAVLPLIYSMVTDKLPGLPLDANTFSTLIIYIVGLMAGGWQVSNAFKLYKHNTDGCFKMEKGEYKKIS